MNNINVVLTEPIYLHTTFILAVILFLPAYISLIILIILFYSFCFRIIKVSSLTMEYGIFSTNVGWNSSRMMKILVWLWLEFLYKHTGILIIGGGACLWNRLHVKEECSMKHSVKWKEYIYPSKTWISKEYYKMVLERVERLLDHIRE